MYVSPFFFIPLHVLGGGMRLLGVNSFPDRNKPIVAEQNGMMGTMMQDLAFAIPGVDEAMSFAEIMK
jgi:hypothetical protein